MEYIKPKLEVVNFDTEDVITTSSNNPVVPPAPPDKPDNPDGEDGSINWD